MRYQKIDPQLFVHNRQRLIQQFLKPNAVVVLHANDIMPKNGDGTLPFHQNSDLFYLSGIDQEETILVLYPDAPKEEWREMLFIKETNERTKVWEGQKHTQEAASALSGISQVHWLQDFRTTFHTLMVEAGCVYLNTNEHARSTSEVPDRDARFIQWCKEHYPLHQYERLAPLMRHLRAIKSDAEIELIREACAITDKAFRHILPLIKPGIMEYEIEAELACILLRNRSRGFAYEPIVASGANACILHYIANDQQCRDGDTILLDFGAEYANYGADLTRVLPVNGRFTPRQRAVYNAVLQVMQQAKKFLVPGNDMATYHQQVGEVMEQALVGLGLIDRKDIQQQDPQRPAYKKYFMHGTSHHLGLSIHDVGDAYRYFEPGMVLTIEPGIYIPEEKLGIRLENDVIIRKEGVEDLMATTPLEAEEIEELMQRR